MVMRSAAAAGAYSGFNFATRSASSEPTGCPVRVRYRSPSSTSGSVVLAAIALRFSGLSRFSTAAQGIGKSYGASACAAGAGQSATRQAAKVIMPRAYVGALVCVVIGVSDLSLFLRERTDARAAI